MKIDVLDNVEALIWERKTSKKQDSYVAHLFNSGLDRILKKIGEEAGEVIIASKNYDTHEICHEAADLLFHLMVVLSYHNLKLDDVIAVLDDRNKQKVAQK